MKVTHPTLKTQPTYVYIDVSNIRLACQKTLNTKIDFNKLLSYFKSRYCNLIDVRYYEGIAKDDTRKRHTFDNLQRQGYTICALERKSYHSIEIEKRTIKCPKCDHKWITKFTKRHQAMKSNVDVYLATELLGIAHQANTPTHIILVSCDGDYAEMIASALQNQNISISVLATPPVKDPKHNTLSVKLRAVRKDMPRYQLTNIASIIDLIAK